MSLLLAASSELPRRYRSLPVMIAVAGRLLLQQPLQLACSSPLLLALDPLVLVVVVFGLVVAAPPKPLTT